ncbi:hypothetical protein [Paracoccus sp. (in: a-proteobacteria)]|uniref:hypothetical protein n=1 Tax=Paracoccus sp. TaxID=267 RepID=UPI003A84B758
MILSVLVTIRNDTPGLATHLHQLARALDRLDRLVIVHDEVLADTAAHLRRFSEGPGRGAHILALDRAELVPRTLCRLARLVTATEYALHLGPQDFLCPDVIADLDDRLRQDRPDLAICASGWWVAGPYSALPEPETARLAEWADNPPAPGQAPGQALSLRPDPRRLVLRDTDLDSACREALRDGDPAADWACHDRIVGGAASIRVVPTPVLLFPLPAAERVARALTAARHALSAKDPKTPRDTLRARILQRLSDELRHAGPAHAGADMAAARDLAASLSFRERRALRHATCPAGQLLAAAAAGDHALMAGILTQQAAARDRAAMLALQDEIARLRRDLDLALPGPEYLLQLYERLRPR